MRITKLNIDENYNELHGLVLNAAILGKMSALSDYDLETWNKVMNVNLTSQFMLAKTMLPILTNSQKARIIFTSSGGARMQEGIMSLMQMAKTAAKLTQLSEKKIPYISLCIDPTTGGTTASFAMLGDIIISEPGALIGFAGPRVVKDTTGQDLPQGFQSSEFLLEHGFIDFICHRNDLKFKINFFIDLIRNKPLRNYGHN